MSRSMLPLTCLAGFLIVAQVTLAAAPPGAGSARAGAEVKATEVDGLLRAVDVRRDQNRVPHIFAFNDHDALFMLGWVHAEDRFFQMDVLRRTFSGTLAELVGAAALPQDVQLRTLGLRRAAEATLPAISDGGREWLEAYAEGVNAYLASADLLPPEYGALMITKAGVPEWTVVDTLTITKGLAFGLSFDLDDLDYTEAFLSFQAAGQLFGFDGAALFAEGLYRSAPFDPSISIPGFLDPSAALATVPAVPKTLPAYLDRNALALVHSTREKLAGAPALKQALDRRNAPQGSNWWVAGAAITESGYAMLANDPHLALDTPSTFYEVHLRVDKRQGQQPLNVFGVSFPGTSGVIQGCNPWICWGSTWHPMDVTDVYLEEVVIDPVLGPSATLFDGMAEPLVPIPQTYRVNALQTGAVDVIVDSGIGVTDPGGLTLVVPRRNNGPILDLRAGADPLRATAISVQYTGWGPTREADTIREFARARSIDDFLAALQTFDVGSQNWSVANRRGDIAYFTSAELPIREDLQTFMAPDGGVPPYFLRDGTHTLRHEWMGVENPQPEQSLGFEILPFSEMPQVRNPAAGYVLNANNDPVGTSLDNNPLNQLRSGGRGLYYLSPGYATGFRIGRLQRLFDQALADGGTVSADDFKAMQANNQLLDAEVLTPYLLDAFANAGAPGAPAALAALGADPGVAEAIGRLGAWDFSTPTGIPEGYDPGDDPTDLPAPVQTEIDASVAATLYSVWRGQVVQAVIDDTLQRLEDIFGILDPPQPVIPLTDQAPGSALALSALRHLLDTFDEMGGNVGGVDFFVVPATDDPAAARDIILLQGLRDALDLLAGDAFAAAFHNSTDQGDYRWGYLHRIVFDHVLGDPFSVPPSGLPNLGDELAGISRAGGLGSLDAAAHSARADGVDEFRFGSGPARRFVGVMRAQGPVADEVIPGGESGVIGSPFQVDQLLLWLTNRYHGFTYRARQVDRTAVTHRRFIPPRAGS